MELLIQNGVLTGCRDMEPETALVLPEGIHAIAEKAFFECKQLRTIQIPGSVRTIGKEAFSFCRNLRHVRMKEGTEELGVRVFQSCSSLKSITLPQSLRRIGSSTFSECTSLGTLKLPAKLEFLPPFLCAYCTHLWAVTLPTAITEIPIRTFRGCTALQQVELPDTVQSIGSEAFLDCRTLRSIRLPKGLKTIGPDAFRRCSALAELVVPEQVTEIGRGAFQETGIERLELRCPLQKLPACMLKGGTFLVDLILQDTLTELGEMVFSGSWICHLTVVQGSVRIRIPMFSRSTGKLADVSPKELLQLLCHRSAVERVERAVRWEREPCYPMLMFYFSLLYDDPRCKAAVERHFPDIAKEFCLPENEENCLSLLEHGHLPKVLAEGLLEFAAEQGGTRLVPHLLRYLHTDGGVTGDWTL